MTMKMQVTPTFPGLVTAIPPLFVTLSNGTYTFSIGNNPIRLVTDSAPVIVSATEAGVGIDRTVAGATSVTLPASASRNGQPIRVADLKGDSGANNITVTPNGTEVINKAANDIIDANFAVRDYYPLPNGGGYYVA